VAGVTALGWPPCGSGTSTRLRRLRAGLQSAPATPFSG
jgi:hypothetical protein